MIIGIGTDLVEITRIKQAVTKRASFAKRVLTDKEWEIYATLTSEKRALEFLAGRWAAKEACAKAWGTGITGQLGFRDMEVRANRHGRPIISAKAIDYKIHLSITHTEHYAQAFVVIEDSDREVQ